MASTNPRSPRQKMINLMYLVFIAMLAINLPEEVLDGFDMVDEGLNQTIKSSEAQNELTFKGLTDINNQNPVKAEQWYAPAAQFSKASDELYNYIQDLKTRIVKKADGEKGDVNNIENRENIDASTDVMLVGINNEAKKLKSYIDVYREQAINLITGTSRKDIIKNRLNTDNPKRGNKDNKNWEEALFEQMPTSVTVTMLTKIQSDIRATQGEVLADLYNQIGAKDYRVNSLQAEVVPKSEYVMEGGAYEGRVVLTAVDTTKRPSYSLPSINANGEFKIPAGGVGINKIFSGMVTLSTPEGEVISRPFKSEYHVVPRMTTIQVSDANVLYQGEDNKLTISVPGLSNDQLRVTATNGSITKSGQNWIAKPAKAGTNMKISVFNGTNFVSDQEFKVRLLPDPVPYIEYADAEGNPKRYKGGRVAKSVIVNATGVKAAIDDGLIDRQFPVTKFTTVFFDGMGNAIREVSDGSNFSERQKAQIRQLARGKSFFISDVKVRGKDGVERDLAAIEVRIN